MIFDIYYEWILILIYPYKICNWQQLNNREAAAQRHEVIIWYAIRYIPGEHPLIKVLKY